MRSTFNLQRVLQTRTSQVKSVAPCLIPKATVYMGKPPRTPVNFRKRTLPRAPHPIGVNVATALSDTKLLTINKQHSMVVDIKGEDWTVLPFDFQEKLAMHRLESLHYKDGKAYLITTGRLLQISLGDGKIEELERCPLDDFVTARVEDNIYAIGLTKKDELFNDPMKIFKYSLGPKGSWSQVKPNNMSVLPRKFDVACSIKDGRIFAFYSNLEETAYIMETRVLNLESLAGGPTWVVPDMKGMKPTGRQNMSVASFVDPISDKSKILCYGGSYEWHRGVGGLLNDLDVIDVDMMAYEGIPTVEPKFKGAIDSVTFASVTPVGKRGLVLLGGHDSQGPKSSGTFLEFKSASTNENID